MNVNLFSIGMKMKNSESFPVESAASFDPPMNSKHHRVNVDEFFYDSSFLEKLRLEKLRAQRSKSTLSIILLTLDKEAEGESINMNEILGVVRAKTRDTDISGFVNHKTIGILLPDTDELARDHRCHPVADRQRAARPARDPARLVDRHREEGPAAREQPPRVGDTRTADRRRRRRRRRASKGASSSKPAPRS